MILALGCDLAVFKPPKSGWKRLIGISVFFRT